VLGSHLILIIPVGTTGAHTYIPMEQESVSSIYSVIQQVIVCPRRRDFSDHRGKSSKSNRDRGLFNYIKLFAAVGGGVLGHRSQWTFQGMEIALKFEWM
jgi:hypothetical protein